MPPKDVRWSAADIPGLEGRTAVVTGANSGLGYHTALELARHGARVTMACRDRARGEAALARLRQACAHAAADLALLDLADLRSVREFATSWQGAHDRLDLLVNNAGVMALPHRRTVDGFEMQLGTNHLGHFALTGLLLSALLRPAGDARRARVVTVSSAAHRMGTIERADLQRERRYRKWAAYGQSKLANLLFMRELDARAVAADALLDSVAAHPGLAATNLQTAGPQMAGRAWLGRVTGTLTRVLAQSDAAGALPSLRAATDPGVLSGEYLGPQGPGETRGAPVRVGMSDAARDDATARWLWQRSEELTGVSYDALGARR